MITLIGPEKKFTSTLHVVSTDNSVHIMNNTLALPTSSDALPFLSKDEIQKISTGEAVQIRPAYFLGKTKQWITFL